MTGATSFLSMFVCVCSSASASSLLSFSPSPTITPPRLRNFSSTRLSKFKCLKSGQPYRCLGTAKNPSTTTFGILFPSLNFNLTGKAVEKNGNIELSHTASINSSRVSNFVVNTGRLLGNNSLCASATTPSRSLMISCASGDNTVSISISSNGSNLPIALPPCCVSHASQTRTAASNARSGGVFAACAATAIEPADAPAR